MEMSWEIIYSRREIEFGVRSGMKPKVEKEDINGIYRTIADLVGIENAKLIFEEYRGQQITFPVEFYNKRYVYKTITEEFDGSNIRYLAKKYGYSERTIRRILKEQNN